MLIIFIIAIGLSMDAFSLALAYGTLNLDKKIRLKLSFIVGLYHFFMPILGFLIGSALLNIIKIQPTLLIFCILFFIGLQMIIETFKKEEHKNIMTLKELLLFGFAVSLDSFSVGIGLKTINDNLFLSSLIFSICSFLFTYMGLYLGKKISKLLGYFATLIGGIILMIIGILYLIH